MAQAKYRGRFVWQELMTEDTAAAATFYTKLLGWNAQPSQVDTSYTQLSVGDRGVAGMMKLPDSAKSMGAKPMWMSYITVDEVDPAVTQLESLGGKVIRPAMDIPKVGRFAIVTDPQGAVFALFKPDGPPPGPARAPVPGEISWMELATTDHEAAFTFYARLFGWQALQRHDMGPMGTYLIFGSDGVQQGGMFKMGAERGSTPAWLAYAAVTDADLCAKEIPGLGGRVLNGPMDVPDGGRIVQLADPQGVMFAIHAQATPKVQTSPAKPAAPTAKPAPKPAVPKPEIPKTAAPAAKPAAPKPAAAKPAAVVPAKTAPARPPAAKPAVASAPAAKKVVKKAAKKATKKAAKKVVKKAVKKVAKKKLAKKASKSVAKKKTSAAARKSASKPMKRKLSKKDKKHKKKDKKKNKKNKKSGKGKRKK